MLNAEKYRDGLKSLNDADKLWCSAFNKYDMTFDSCLNVKCEKCPFYNIENMMKWLKEGE